MVVVVGGGWMDGWVAGQHWGQRADQSRAIGGEWVEGLGRVNAER